MIVLETHLGSVRITKSFLYSLVQHTVINCFGVAGLNDSSLCETVQTALFPDRAHRGIGLRIHKNTLTIELHIITGIGANIPAITASIREKVRYAVEQAVGLTPEAINVYVDDIRS